MRYLIMTVGYMHSGKTTFGQELAATLPHVACLERDPIAAMLNEHFAPVLENDRANWHAKGHERLKDKVFNLIFEEAIADPHLTIILTGCHIAKDFRLKTIKELMARMPDCKTIMVYFDVDQTELERRVCNSVKPTNILTVSKSFLESLHKQRERFETPTADEADHFFTIKDNQNTEEVIAQIKALLSSKSD